MARKIPPLALLIVLAATGGAAMLGFVPFPEGESQEDPAGARGAGEPHESAPPAGRAATNGAVETSRRPARAPIDWRDSTAVGSPGGGSLDRGVKLPPAGRRWFTWDPVKRVSPSAPWRRWGTDALVRTVMRVIRGYARAHPGAPRVGIGDLSLPKGGYFGPEVSGGIGHATHQNGLDVDVYYPLRSGAERAPLRVSEIRLHLAQDLVDRFVAAGAEVIYVGPSTGLTGPPGVVVPATNHDNHLHARIPNPG